MNAAHSFVTPPPHASLAVLADADAVAEAAARAFVDAAQSSCARFGGFRVALSGGTTPRALFVRLTAAPWRDAVAWERVDFFWGDERAVPPDHPDSNFAMAHDTLLAPLGIAPERIHRLRGEDRDLAAEARRYEALLRALPARPGDAPGPLDLVMLGLGADGHTASLFPGQTVLGEARHWVRTCPGPPPVVQRLTLTFACLERARQTLLLVTGSGKAEALARALADQGSVAETPARGVALVKGSVRWIVDRAAAAALPAETVARASAAAGATPGVSLTNQRDHGQASAAPASHAHAHATQRATGQHAPGHMNGHMKRDPDRLTYG